MQGISKIGIITLLGTDVHVIRRLQEKNIPKM